MIQSATLTSRDRSTDIGSLATKLDAKLRHHPLNSLRTGIDPREETTIGEQIERADNALYKDNRKKRDMLQVAK